ncbi:OmpA/MotB domain protein [Mycolicibacterium rhodesiae JS60]|nr:OmpA/MotB domain protein [Mycolicibacterium rhodesiae JS60]
MTSATVPFLALPLRARRLIPAVVAMSTAAGLLAGCSNTQAAPSAPLCDTGQALVLVVSVHQGASAPAIPSAAACLVETALKSAVPISIVTAEGTPRLLMKSATWTLNDGQPESSNPQAYGDDLGAARAAVLRAVQAAKATSDHNNLAAALAMAADQGHQTSATGVRILVVDNGLSDAGAVNMAQPGMTAANRDEVAQFVRSHGGCPSDLSGTTMTLYGAGYGVDPQPRLASQQLTAVGQIWQKVIEACGGHLDLVPTPRTDAGPDTTFTVTPVPVIPDAVVPAHPAGASVTFGDDGPLHFKPDSAELTDPTAAQQTLKPVADYLNEDPGHVITIFGTTSNGRTAWDSYTALAQARSLTVQQILTSALGVRSGQIHCVGLGYTADPPVVDPATAALNRRTRISFDT